MQVPVQAEERLLSEISTGHHSLWEVWMFGERRWWEAKGQNHDITAFCSFCRLAVQRRLMSRPRSTAMPNKWPLLGSCGRMCMCGACTTPYLIVPCFRTEPRHAPVASTTHSYRDGHRRHRGALGAIGHGPCWTAPASVGTSTYEHRLFSVTSCLG